MARAVLTLVLCSRPPCSGNASPFPVHCNYPPGYAQYQPSLIRIEDTLEVTLANVNVQLSGHTSTKCGQFNTGFAGVFYDPRSFSIILDVHNTSTATYDWPVVYKRGS